MFDALLITTTLLCGLVAGFLLGFAVVAMPGISSLEDREFIRSFQVMDGVIQRNQPIFVLMWVGSTVGTVATAGIGMNELDAGPLALVVLAAALYLLGVQLPTIVINIPLNNRLQLVSTEDAEDDLVARARSDFEAKWNTWNRVRTVLAISTTALLLIVLSQR